MSTFVAHRPNPQYIKTLYQFAKDLNLQGGRSQNSESGVAAAAAARGRCPARRSRRPPCRAGRADNIDKAARSRAVEGKTALYSLCFNSLGRNVVCSRVPTAQQGKWHQKIPYQGKHGIWKCCQNTGNFVKIQGILSKHREFCQNTGNFVKTQGILFAF